MYGAKHGVCAVAVCVQGPAVQQPQRQVQPQPQPQPQVQPQPQPQQTIGDTHKGGNVAAQRPVVTGRPATPKPEEPEVEINTLGSVEPETTPDDKIDVGPDGGKKGVVSGWFEKLSVIFAGKDNDEYTF